MPSVVILESSVVFAVPDCEAPSSKPFVRVATRRAAPKARCSCPSRPRRRAASDRFSRQAPPSRRLLATRLAPPPPQSVFLAEAHPLEQTQNSGVAQGFTRGVLQEATSL